MGLIPGRGADLHRQAKLSLEAGASWYTKQLQWSSARINYKPSRAISLYVDYAKLRASNVPMANSLNANFAGIGFGGGFLFAVPDTFNAFDVAFKASYHASVIEGVDATVDVDEPSYGGEPSYSGENNLMPSGSVQIKSSSPTERALDQSQWSAALIFSPIDPIYENGLSWYSTLGYVSTSARTKTRMLNLNVNRSVDYQQTKGFALGLGIVQPISYGQLYAGFEWLAGDPLIGAGFRYAFR